MIAPSLELRKLAQDLKTINALGIKKTKREKDRIKASMGKMAFAHFSLKNLSSDRSGLELQVKLCFGILSLIFIRKFRGEKVRRKMS